MRFCNNKIADITMLLFFLIKLIISIFLMLLRKGLFTCFFILNNMLLKGYDVESKEIFSGRPNPVGIYLLKVSNRNIREMCEICSKLTIKTPGRRQWRCFGVFIVNFEHILHLVLVFLLLTLNMQLPAGKVIHKCRLFLRYLRLGIFASWPFGSFVNWSGISGGIYTEHLWWLLLYFCIKFLNFPGKDKYSTLRIF